MRLPANTPRLRFRAFDCTDQAVCEHLFSDAEVMRYFDGVRSIEQTRDWLDRVAQSYRGDGFGPWALHRLDDDAFLGYCGLILQRDVDDADEIEIGYSLDPRYWGNGYATEAAAACRDHVFDVLNQPRVISLIDPRNLASVAVAGRIGHRYEKTVHRWDKPVDVYSQQSPGAITFRIDDLEGDAINALLQQHLDDMQAYSPPESMHALDLSGLRKPGITVWSAWRDGTLLGCGALMELDARHAEIKSMRIDNRYRGQGLGRAILDHLQGEAGKRGYTRLSLETGSTDEFLPARRLYESAGFHYCDPFGDYQLDPWSVFMTRELS